MPTDDERRRLAGNMRVFDVFGDGSGRYWLNGTLFGMDVSAWSEEDLRNGMAHLASFIEPDAIPDNPDRTERSLSEPKVDRDALLVLADDLTRMSTANGVILEGEAKTIARKIREAVGE